VTSRLAPIVFAIHSPHAVSCHLRGNMSLLCERLDSWVGGIKSLGTLAR